MNWPWKKKPSWREDVTQLLTQINATLASDVKGGLATINNTQAALLKRSEQIMATLLDVKEQVDAVKADVEKLIAKVTDLAAQLAAAIANQDPVAIQAISDELTATAAEAEAALNPPAQ